MNESSSVSVPASSAVVGFLESRLTPGTENFREGAKVLLRVIYVQLFVIVLLTGLVVHYVSPGFVADNYFTLTAEGPRGGGGVKTWVTALDEPGYGKQGVIDWATVAVSRVLTFGFNNVDERMSQSRYLFTSTGWESFVKAVSAKRIVESVQMSQQLVTAIPRGQPEIKSEGFSEGKYSWTISIPMVLTARAGKKTGSARMTVEIVVVKVPTEIDPKGLGIEKWDET